MQNQSKKRKEDRASKADLLFEVSWEAGNKVGGIYAVLASKALDTVRYYNSNYYLIGPYLPDKLKGEFQEQTPPALFKELFLSLEKERGIRCHFGKWLIPEEPFLILVDFQDLWKEINQIKARLWEDYQIDSL
ncbi:MAG: glycogen synthase, partial [Candidatus Jacksonbacteria bacterium]